MYHFKDASQLKVFFLFYVFVKCLTDKILYTYVYVPTNCLISVTVHEGNFARSWNGEISRVSDNMKLDKIKIS